MTEVQPPDQSRESPPAEPVGTLVSGKVFLLVAAGLFVLFGGFAMWLSNLRVRTKPAIDICNTIGIELEEAAGAAVRRCLHLPDAGAVPSAEFSAVDDRAQGFVIKGTPGSSACEGKRAEFIYRFTPPCPEMARDVELGVNLPLKDANSVRDDIGPAVQDACRTVLEMNCDCRKIRSVPAGIYETACRNIDEDRKSPAK